MKKNITIVFLISLITNSLNVFSQPDPMPPPTLVYDVYTPKGSKVYDYAVSPSDVVIFDEMTEDNIAYYDTIYNSVFPNATIISYSTAKYNCHGYAWHYIEHGSKRWIGLSSGGTVKAYMDSNNGSYKKITSSTGADNKVYYRFSNHSAITTSTPGIVRSKWGPGPVYEHSLTDCPDYNANTQIEYWTIKPDISGSTNKLCYNVNREFEEETITKFDVDYDWDASGDITVVSSVDYYDIYTVKGNSQIGTGTVTLTVTTPSGNTGSSDVSFDVNCQPDPYSVSIIIDEQGGGWVDEVCPHTNYYIYVTNDDSDCSTSSYSWDLPAGWSEYYSSSNMILANSGASPEGILEISATTECGTTTEIFSETIYESDDCGGYYMMISPNPSTLEAILEIKPFNENYFEEDMDWELEIYSQTQILKEKKTKIKGTKYIIQTAGWKEGVYFVRVKLKDKIKSGALVVTK